MNVVGCAVPCSGIGNEGMMLARSVSRGNVLWRNWIVSGGVDSCELIGIIKMEDDGQE